MGKNERGHSVVETMDDLISRGKLKGYFSIQKFGRNPDLGTTLEDIWSLGGIYEFPTTAETIGIVSDNAADDYNGGSGTRQICLSGINDSWNYDNECVNLSGTNNINTTKQYVRTNRLKATMQGTYGRSNVSNAGTIIASGASQEHIELEVTPTKLGQSQIARYSIAKNHYAILNNISISVDGVKTADVMLFVRENAMKTTAPFGAVNMKGIWDDVGTFSQIHYDSPIYINATSGADVWFAGIAGTGGTKVSVTYDLKVYPIIF